MPSITDTFSGRTSYDLRMSVVESSIDEDNNRSKVDWSLTILETSEYGSWSNAPMTWSINVGGQTASGSDTYDFRNYNSLVLGTGSFWITHNSDGSKTISYSMSAGGSTVLGSASDSGSFALSDIPRASTASFSPDNQLDPGVAVTINTNRASTSFTHTITYKLGAASGTIATGVGASTSWTPAMSLLNEIPNATSLVGSITVKTYNGSTLIGTTTTNFRLHVPTSVVPDFTTVTHAEATAGVASNVGAYVQKVSTLALAITGAAGAYSSTITSYSIKVKNSSGTVLQTLTSSSGTTTPVDASGTVTLEGTVTDSRGRTATKTVTTTFLAWAAPKIITPITAKRALNTGVANEEGTYIRVDINASVSSLVNSTQRNALVYKISTRVRGTTTWTLKKTVTPGGITFNGFDTVSTYSTTTAYDVLVEILDDFATSAQQLVVATSGIFMHWGDGSAGQGLGVGKFWERGALDVRGTIWANDAQIEPPGIILPYAGPTSPAGFLLCDGAAVSRTTYAALFAIIGTAYGAGNGTSTFNVPNLKGRVPMGRDSAQTEFDVLGETGGAKTHSHVLSAAGHALIGIGQPNGNNRIWNVAATDVVAYSSDKFTTVTGVADGVAGGTTSNKTALGGSTNSTSNLDPYQVVNYIIKI